MVAKLKAVEAGHEPKYRFGARIGAKRPLLADCVRPIAFSACSIGGHRLAADQAKPMTDQIPTIDAAASAIDLLEFDVRLRYAIFREAGALTSIGRKIHCKVFGDGPDATLVWGYLEGLEEPVSPLMQPQIASRLLQDRSARSSKRRIEDGASAKGDDRVEFAFDMQSGQSLGGTTRSVPSLARMTGSDATSRKPSYGLQPTSYGANRSDQGSPR